MTSATFDLAAARAHVADLVARHRLMVATCSTVEGAESFPAVRAIRVPHVTNPRTYLVALHEIGHVLSRNARRLATRFDFPGEFACEAWAWSWACEAVPPAIASTMTPRDWRNVGQLLGTYAVRCGQELRAAGRYPEGIPGDAPDPTSQEQPPWPTPPH